MLFHGLLRGYVRRADEESGRGERTRRADEERMR
jgi:hypothetical protein